MMAQSLTAARVAALTLIVGIVGLTGCDQKRAVDYNDKLVAFGNDLETTMIAFRDGVQQANDNMEQMWKVYDTTMADLQRIKTKIQGVTVIEAKYAQEFKDACTQFVQDVHDALLAHKTGLQAMIKNAGRTGVTADARAAQIQKKFEDELDRAAREVDAAQRQFAKANNIQIK